MEDKKRACLVILDGWGIGKHDDTDAIFNANTPFVNSLYKDAPNTTLVTFGNAVGLPEGQMGNSEVGHLNLGAGRVVWQQLELINRTFANHSAIKMESILEVSNYCKQNSKPLHLIGLVSNGGVHSSMEHLISLCQIYSQLGVESIYIHAFTDGRDTDPHSGKAFLAELQEKINDTNAQIATIIGRYYAMDRDKRWERVAKAYHLLVHSVGQNYTELSQVFDDNYAKGITDEFINPSVICNTDGKPIAQIQENDAVICFNFRTDRGRQITEVLTQNAFHEYNMHPLQLNYSTMTMYDENFKGILVIFPTQNISNTLGEIVCKKGLTQLRCAETEKYPHVTFFFSGGREEPFEGEQRILEPSPKVATYDLQPEMSAIPLTEKTISFIQQNTPDFVCLNYANTDMVGHTGVWEAIVKAAETVDSCLEKLVAAGRKLGYQFVILADHGNADEAKNADGTPNTAHSTNPVPCFILSDKVQSVSEGKLADIAPTILTMLGIEIPAEMNGNVLIKD